MEGKGQSPKGPRSSFMNGRMERENREGKKKIGEKI